jgi:hypothetical protein
VEQVRVSDKVSDRVSAISPTSWSRLGLKLGLRLGLGLCLYPLRVLGVEEVVEQVRVRVSDRVKFNKIADFFIRVRVKTISNLTHT